MVGKVYGIDLGTTTSCIACVDEHGKPEIVNNSEGQPTTPSVVWFTEDGTAVVGQNAKHESVVHPDRVVSLVKRVMGNADWLFSCNGKSYKPQEISAHILRKLVNDAQNERGDEIKDVVITCPAYFGVNEREATRQAGQIAGLNVLQIIPEPTAAALAYGMGQERDQVVMVYDLGGGTFDVTVIDVKDKHLRVVAVGGNHRLGGADWDSVIVTYFEQEFERQKNISVDMLERNLETRQQLLNEAERTKIGLSTVNKRDYRIRHEAESAMVSLTREKLMNSRHRCWT
jgi:molecular chaperone DnaK